MKLELRGLTGSVLDLIFPPRCVGCNKRGAWICPDCIAGFSSVKPPLCRICGHPTDGTVLCRYCYKTPLRIEGIRASHYFDGALRRAIHQFKYRRAKHLAEPLARIMADYIRANPLEFEVLVPVPLHGTRVKERGYNQSELLAAELAHALHVPVAGGTLQRIRPTASQMGLPAAERKPNVRGAFQCLDRSLAGKSILLIDDVCTTGATLEACSVALKQAGAAAVWGMCIARARLEHENHAGRVA